MYVSYFFILKIQIPLPDFPMPPAHPGLDATCDVSRLIGCNIPQPSPAQPSPGWQVKGLGANVSTFSLQNVADMKLIWPPAFFIPGPGGGEGVNCPSTGCIQHSYGGCMLHDGRLDQKTNSSLIILINIIFRIQQLTFHTTQFRVLGFIMDLKIRVQAVCLKQSDKEGGLSFK